MRHISKPKVEIPRALGMTRFLDAAGVHHCNRGSRSRMSRIALLHPASGCRPDVSKVAKMAKVAKVAKMRVARLSDRETAGIEGVGADADLVAVQPAIAVAIRNSEVRAER